MRWSYKTIRYELKKDGILGSAFLDETEMEESLNQYGKSGWELVSVLESLDGVIAILKQPLDLGPVSMKTGGFHGAAESVEPRGGDGRSWRDEDAASVVVPSIHRKLEKPLGEEKRRADGPVSEPDPGETVDEDAREAVLLDEQEPEDRVRADVTVTPRSAHPRREASDGADRENDIGNIRIE